MVNGVVDCRADKVGDEDTPWSQVANRVAVLVRGLLSILLEF